MLLTNHLPYYSLFIYCHVHCLYFQNNCRAHNEPSQVLKELKDNRAANCDHTKAQVQGTHELIRVLRGSGTSSITLLSTEITHVPPEDSGISFSSPTLPFLFG